MAAEQERWTCPECGAVSDVAALGIYARIACPSCGHEDYVHTRLGNFRIDGILGLGGMSVVLRAHDLVLDRPLAIKLLNDSCRDQPERMERFEQECELMAKVRHKNVVSLYSAGHVRGQFYIAMELVNGRNLEEQVREQGPMEPLPALELLCQVVRGLAAASKAGLLHRDMKPGNILINEVGQAKVLDFGLSLGKREADTEEVIWATPYYVPPETLMREAEDVRTDIYALGMTLRHLLTGQHSFEPAPESVEEMLECKRNLPRMAEVLPSLPEAYGELIDHMTAFDASERPDGYASLMEEIKEVRAALLAEKRPFAERLRRAWPLLAGAAATLALGAGAAAITAHLATPEPERLYLSPAETLPWVERDTLAAAMSHMQEGRLEDAAELFTRLALTEGEPAACAWAALHARVLAVLLGEGEYDDKLELVDRLSHHLSRTPAPAGTEMHGQMEAVLAMQGDPADKFLQAARCLLRLDVAAASCREQELKVELQNARIALRGAGRPYAPLITLVSQYESQLAATLPARAESLYLRSLASLDMQEATRALALMESCTREEPARVRLGVQKEALALFGEAVEMMKRRALMPAGGQSVTPERLLRLLEPLEEPELAAEVAILMLMAEGKFDEAAETNHHAANPDSPAPFAVMMRDWLRRVK